jgi:DNA (cytosine-5)-methyltransferase 1
MRPHVPIIDLFAGPGGLGEGFSSVRDKQENRVFDIRLSVENDLAAHQTLLLRALYRKLAEAGTRPDCYYEYLMGRITRAELWNHPLVSNAARIASKEARCATLGGPEQAQIDEWIASSLKRHEEWVLIGGPPCQAYSVVGRSRMRTTNPEKFEQDERHFLYREYLRIIARHRPAVFVMENVKGLLSATNGGRHTFQRILTDLKKPGKGLEYEIRSLNTSGDCLDPRDYIIQSEFHGVPQIRHRVILFGIRKDLASMPHRLLARQASTNNVEMAFAGIPPLRSRISRGPDHFFRWIEILENATTLLKGWERKERKEIEERMMASVAMARKDDLGFGGNAIGNSLELAGTHLADWFSDRHLNAVLNHESRSHMPSDLQRYLFASAFAQVVSRSPKLDDFPRTLLPDHQNVKAVNVPFDDRFRVQVWGNPSSTVVSHIAKDGHYYIHPDPVQCRSLTVREAARLQTFPDNYLFEGNRTQQYTQVGNAVPPYLARQIADIVADFLGYGTAGDPIPQPLETSSGRINMEQIVLIGKQGSFRSRRSRIRSLMRKKRNVRKHF